MNVFARAGRLVYPFGEEAPAANGAKTVTAGLREYLPDSFIEPVAESAIFQRYNARQGVWVDTDPPIHLIRMALARERKWRFLRIVGVITTPTLRPDGSLLATPGYDSETQLYLWGALKLPAIPQHPTREQAVEALAILKGSFVEFSFKRKTPAIDLSVALSGLLTALLRGSLPTAPVILVRGDTPGVGKSYLVDLISLIATGRLCPVITASRNSEETEKRIGAVLLSGSPIVSLDNVTHDLGGELLCQVSERPVVKVRILGRSEMPECECHTTMFATGNNVSFAGDMVRRGLLIDLEALDEQPELRTFQHDALLRAGADRAKCRRRADGRARLSRSGEPKGLRSLRVVRGVVGHGAKPARLARRARPG
jgi:putative DNA primase/helicase